MLKLKLHWIVELFPFNYVPLFNFSSPPPKHVSSPAVMQLPELLLSDARLEAPPGAPRFKSELSAPLRREYAAPALIFLRRPRQAAPSRLSQAGSQLRGTAWENRVNFQNKTSCAAVYLTCLLGGKKKSKKGHKKKKKDRRLRNWDSQQSQAGKTLRFWNAPSGR